MVRQKQVSALTGLRFVAALWVFLFHLQIRWPITARPFVSAFLNQGAVGMSLFFVLSGFVLAYAHRDGISDLEAYATQRFARIYPIYIFAAALALPFLIIQLYQHSELMIFQKPSMVLFLIISDTTLVQAWFPQSFQFWNNSGSWSLSNEMFFYSVFPILISLTLKLSLRQLGALAAVSYLLSVLPGASLGIFRDKQISWLVYYSVPIFRLPEFVCGVCAGVAVTKHKFELEKPAIWSFIFILCLVSFLILIGPYLPYYVTFNFIAVPAFCVVIVSLTQGIGLTSWVLGTAPLCWLGRLSYCFYSFQAAFLFTMAYLVKAFPNLPNSGLFAPELFVALLGLSAIGYYLIEEPARRWLLQYDRKALSQPLEANGAGLSELGLQGLSVLRTIRKRFGRAALTD